MRSGPILLIEDNAQNCYLVTFLLERHGHEVVAVMDGQEGIDVAQTCKPSLILLDLQLPSMDGYCVARALRAFAGLRETPIIAVTSYAMSGDREKALAAGCSGYLEKPIDPDNFVAQISSFLTAPPTPVA